MREPKQTHSEVCEDLVPSWSHSGYELVTEIIVVAIGILLSSTDV